MMKEKKFPQSTNEKITALYERTCHPDTESIRKQKNSLTSLAKQYGLENIRHFIDDGYAYNNDSRPGFNALMDAIRADQVDTLVVFDCTRLTRNYKAFFKLKNELEQHGVKLLSLNEDTRRLPQHLHNGDNGLDYELHGDYYFPMITVTETETAPVTSKWADQRVKYLKESRPILFNQLVTTGKLASHLAEIDKQARERYLTLLEACKKEWNITEELKAKDVMRWIQLMNSAEHEAEWNVMKEIVLC